MDMARPVNTGAEAVETALKAARRWGYRIKCVPEDGAEIVVCDGNFRGRTIASVGFSSEAAYRSGFGPFPLGFVSIPFGDADASKGRSSPKPPPSCWSPSRAKAGSGTAARLSNALCPDLPCPSRIATVRRGPDRARPHRAAPERSGSREKMRARRIAHH
jgi:aminotransferase class III